MKAPIQRQTDSQKTQFSKSSFRLRQKAFGVVDGVAIVLAVRPLKHTIVSIVCCALAMTNVHNKTR